MLEFERNLEEDVRNETSGDFGDFLIMLLEVSLLLIEKMKLTIISLALIFFTCKRFVVKLPSVLILGHFIRDRINNTFKQLLKLFLNKITFQAYRCKYFLRS